MFLGEEVLVSFPVAVIKSSPSWAFFIESYCREGYLGSRLKISPFCGTIKAAGKRRITWHPPRGSERHQHLHSVPSPLHPAQDPAMKWSCPQLRWILLSINLTKVTPQQQSRGLISHVIPDSVKVMALIITEDLTRQQKGLT